MAMRIIDVNLAIHYTQIIPSANIEEFEQQEHRNGGKEK
jgi:hypothetical protein